MSTAILETRTTTATPASTEPAPAVFDDEADWATLLHEDSRYEAGRDD